MLADNAGFDLTLEKSDRDQRNEASRLDFVEYYHGAMTALVKERLSPKFPDRR